jgi:two-component system cell cycle response regulator
VADGRILVAEGDSATAGVIRWLLRENGYAADSANGRGTLIDEMERTIPDVVLLDGDAENVEETVRQIRGNPDLHDVRVIVSLPGDNGRVHEMPAGADDSVTKPYRVPELLARVRTQLKARKELVATREALMTAIEELERAREVSASSRQLVDILNDVTGELSATEIYRVLTRRVARALQISHCSVVIARPGDVVGTVVAAFEDQGVSDLEIRLDDYPEIATALESQRAVLIPDASQHPLYDGIRRRWESDGREIKVRSVITLPFSIDRLRAGVLFIRTDRTERALTPDDVSFAELVLRAAVAVIRRAQALETTRADNRRLEALATTDPLTRVLNRRALLDRLAIEVDRARRFKSVLTLLLLDVDYFKLINDTAGHLAGDNVLRQLAALLEDAVRRIDIVARYGGEEFVLILPETAHDGAAVFAERLRERIAAQAFDVGGERPLHLTVSIGIATFPSPRVESTEDLFARADEALYRAKSGGRNQVRT